MIRPMDEFFSGRKLYGDDFTPQEIEAWYRDEQEGYASLSHNDARTPVYVYHYLNWLHGFRHLPGHDFADVLGVGSAFGEEFTPLLPRIKSLSILDPSDHYVRERIHGVPVRYVKPSSSGMMPFPDQTFDLITCLGVLHHIPNVSLVMSELFRCLKSGGYALVREPIVSLGDWRKPRPALTKRERGIPALLLDELIVKAGFRVVQRTECMFPALARVFLKSGILPYNNKLLTRLDRFFSLLTRRNLLYHRQSFLQKLGPSSIYYVLTR